jgi:hypothetical protein
MHIQRSPDQTGVERQLGVKMHVAEEHLVGICSTSIRRVDLFLFEVLFRDNELLGRGCGETGTNRKTTNP